MLESDERTAATTPSLYELPELPDIMRGLSRGMRIHIDWIERTRRSWCRDAPPGPEPARTQIAALTPLLADLLWLTDEYQRLTNELTAEPPEAVWIAAPGCLAPTPTSETGSWEVKVDERALDGLLHRLGAERDGLAALIEGGASERAGAFRWSVELRLEPDARKTALRLIDGLRLPPSSSDCSVDPEEFALLHIRERLIAVGGRLEIDRPNDPTRLRLQLRARRVG